MPLQPNLIGLDMSEHLHHDLSAVATTPIT